jgi:hypothetical protein
VELRRQPAHRRLALRIPRTINNPGARRSGRTGSGQRARRGSGESLRSWRISKRELRKESEGDAGES